MHCMYQCLKYISTYWKIICPSENLTVEKCSRKIWRHEICFGKFGVGKFVQENSVSKNLSSDKSPHTVVCKCCQLMGHFFFEGIYMYIDTYAYIFPRKDIPQKRKWPICWQPFRQDTLQPRYISQHFFIFLLTDMNCQAII